MNTVTVDIPDLDWLDIRQSLSLALMAGVPVSIRGCGEYFARNPEYEQVLADLKEFLASSGIGEMTFRDGVTGLVPGGFDRWFYEIGTGKFSSAVEAVLLLMPSLFRRTNRTVLISRGVTHSPLSYPTSFVKETLLEVLESTGHYGSMLLQRFGFYGSGGGSLEAKIYPAEMKRSRLSFSTGEGSIAGIRIFIAGISMELANREKALLCRELGLEDNRVSIIDVRDAAGFGNSVQVTVNRGGLPLVITAEMRIYNHAGDFIFDEDAFNEALRDLVERTKEQSVGGPLPEILLREACPYQLLSGTEVAQDVMKGKAGSTLSLCRMFVSHREGQAGL